MGDEVLNGWRWFMGHFARVRQARGSNRIAMAVFYWEHP